jgi:hypothetical protein
MAISGGPGSGKTFTSLTIASLLCPGADKIALIDTEHGSADDYANKFEFQRIALERFDPRLFVKLILKAVDRGFEIIILDSLSAAYAGQGGLLSLVDAFSGNNDNDFRAWKKANPIEASLFATILKAPIHVIATMRSNMHYDVQKDDNGRLRPVKIGIKPIQRKEVEYEFAITAEMLPDNTMIFSKTRCTELNGLQFYKPGEDLVKYLREWLTPVGKEQKAQQLQEMKAAAVIENHTNNVINTNPTKPMTEEQGTKVSELLKKCFPDPEGKPSTAGFDVDAAREDLRKETGVISRSQLDYEKAQAYITTLEKRLTQF